MPELPQQAIENANRVLELNRSNLMALPSVLGTGVGASDIDTAEAAIVVYIDRTTGVRPQLPQSIDGVSVKQIFTDPIIAF